MPRIWEKQRDLCRGKKKKRKKQKEEGEESVDIGSKHMTASAVSTTTPKPQRLCAIPSPEKRKLWGISNEKMLSEFGFGAGFTSTRS